MSIDLKVISGYRDVPHPTSLVIKHASMVMNDDGDGDKVRIVFENGYYLVLQDMIQPCCERRYMTTDDDLSGLHGARLVDLYVSHVTTEVKAEEDVYHESSFLHIVSDRYACVVATHNAHNGHYGGMRIQAQLWLPNGHIGGKVDIGVPER